MSTLNETLTVCRASAGTGKTYTLAANYVALLLDDVSYRSILAVTFTNKATQEMKDRILLFLDNIANNTGKDADNALAAIRQRMTRNKTASDEVLRSKARVCYTRMLEDDDNIHISTIDTFLMQLLNGLGQMLDDASAGAAVELDLNHLIAQAADNVLTKPVYASERMNKLLTAYVNERLDEGKDWDIRGQLIELAKRMYAENVQQMDTDGLIDFDTEAILRYKANADWRQAACFGELRDLYALWSGWSSAADGIKGETILDSFVLEIAQYFDGTCKEDNLFRGFTPALRRKMTENDGEAFIKKYNKNTVRAEEVRQAMVKLDALCRACRRAYYTWKYSVTRLNDLALMSALRGEIQALLVEQNSVLLAQTANKLHRAMAEGDADFILEKAGIRYRHIMLDEFQDTSVLQWENFKPLVEEILANGGTVFIVGDVKQSIYRWRNGDWQIMANLNNETPNIGAYFHAMPLRRNFRSSREVVRFNLELFQTLVTDAFDNGFAAEQYDEQYKPELLADYYNASHEGGFVQVSLVPYSKKREATPTVRDARKRCLSLLFEDLESRLRLGESASKMLILVRDHNEAEAVVAAYRERLPESPVLAQTQIVSCDSFHLDKSLSVQFVIQSLRWIVLQDEVAKCYLRLVFDTFDITQLDSFNSEIPLGELLEELIKILPSQHKTDVSYINALLDGVHEYVAKYGADSAAFLQYWEDIMHAQSIAAPTAEAIRIMTIHASKGLEAANVFIPFCSWEMEKDRDDDVLWCEARAMLKAPVKKLKHIPIQMSPRLTESEYSEEYTAEHIQQRMDHLNLLYVALTRAANTLYIYGEIWDSKIGTNTTPATMLEKVFSSHWSCEEEVLKVSFGDAKPVVEEKKNSEGKMIDRFSFDQAAVLPATLHIGERPILFRMSRESLDSLRFGAENEERAARIDLGNVCHYIMEQMETRADQDSAIADARISGLIADEAAETEIVQLIDGAWSNAQMCDWFSGRWELLREATFLTANGELRPDRVMIDREASKAIVLDYKFGQREVGYAQQVRGYMRLMAEMHFQQVKGYLWYAQEAQLQQVTMR